MLSHDQEICDKLMPGGEKKHKIQTRQECFQGKDKMKEEDNGERNVTDEIGSSNGAAEGGGSVLK